MLRRSFAAAASCCVLLALLPGQEPDPKDPRDNLQRQIEALRKIPIPSDSDVGAGPPLELTLGEALRIGANNNTALRVQELVPLEVAEDLRGSRLIFEPEMFARAEVGNSREPARNIFQPALSRTQFNSTLGVRQLVPSGGLLDFSWSPTRVEQNAGIPGFPPKQFTSTFRASFNQPLLRGAWADYTMRNIRIQQSALAAARERYEQTMQDTLFAIVQGYWELVFVRDNYRVAQQALALAQEQLRITNERIRVRELAPLDRVEDEAEVARRREELLNAENAIRDQEDVVRRLLFDDGGAVWTRPLQPVSNLDVEPSREPIDWREAASVGLRERPDLRALRADVAVAEVERDVAERDVLPRLDLIGEYSTDGVSDEFRDAFQDSASSAFPDWSLLLELSVPIGNTGALSLRDRTRLEVERVRRIVYGAELDVVQDVRVAVRQLDTSAQTIERGRESVRLAQTNLDREQERLRVGDSTRFLVQQRNQELQEARTRLLRNLLDYRIAEAGLLAAQGTLGVPEDDDAESSKR